MREQSTRYNEEISKNRRITKCKFNPASRIKAVESKDDEWLIKVPVRAHMVL